MDKFVKFHQIEVEIEEFFFKRQRASNMYSFTSLTRFCFIVIQHVLDDLPFSCVYCSVSEDEIDMYELTEADGDLQIVTECWVEPQYGVVVNSTPERQHWEGLTYKQIARAVSNFLVYGIYTIWLHQDSLSINFQGFCG